ncbi:MAG: Cache 3/Cache 2 fusion domain-containing protein [Spirochaetota bacterium]
MKNFFHNSTLKLGSKLIIFQAVVIIIVLLVLALIAGQLIKSRFTEQSTNEMTDLNKRIIEMIDVYNLKLKEHAVSLANVLINYSNNGRKNQNISQDNIDRFTRITGAVATLFIREGDDFRRASTSLRKQDGTRAVGTLLDKNHPGYKKVLAGESYTGPAVLFGRNYMTHYEPVKDGDRVTGIHFIGLDFTEGIKNLKNKIRSITVAKTGYVYIIEGNKSEDRGKAVVHKSDKLENKDISYLKDKDGNEFIKTMLREMNGMIKYDWTDERGTGIKYAVFSYYDEWNWIIASSAMERELISDGLVMRNYLFAGFFLCSIVILIVLYFAVKKLIMVRFNKLNDVVKDLSEGEGDLTITIDIESNDELGTLAGNFNKFVKKIRDVISDIMNVSGEMTRMSAQLYSNTKSFSESSQTQAASVEEVNATTEELSAGMEFINEITQTQHENLSAMVEKMSDLSGLINTMEANIRKSHELTSAMSQSAKTGEASILSMNASMNKINDSSAKVSSIIQIITDISDKINLLSLNAAIESARAGEAGRGFAVVAQEISKLADGTAGSIKEIDQLIKLNNSEIVRGIEISDETSRTIGGIIKSVESISSMMNSMKGFMINQLEAKDKMNALSDVVKEKTDTIKNATFEHLKSTEEIVRATANINEMTQSIAAGAEEMAGMSEEISGSADALKAKVNFFKV